MRHGSTLVLNWGLAVASMVATAPGAAADPPALRGELRAAGAGVVLEIHRLRIENGCPGRALGVEGGASIEASDVSAVTSGALPCAALLFTDGFESGDASAWSG